MRYVLIFILLISGISLLISGESLWDSDFKGYISVQTKLVQGDIVIVLIETSFSLSHISTQKDSKTISFEYRGGEFSNLLSFLPDIKTGVDNNIKGDEKYSLNTDMVARVVSVENEYAYIKGTREIAIDSKKESITISGYINANDIDQQRRIPFSKIADSKLVFQTFLYPSEYILKEEDIEDILEEITVSEEEIEPEGEDLAEEDVTEVPGTEEETETTETGEPGLEEIPSQPVKSQPTLSKEKKIELFLKYLNRMIDLLFN